MAAIDPALSVAEFRSHFPEFPSGGTSDALITAKLGAASLFLDPEVWGDKVRIGALYLAAHMLATSPYGTNARLATADSTSTYGAMYEQLRATVAKGYGLL